MKTQDSDIANGLSTKKYVDICILVSSHDQSRAWTPHPTVTDASNMCERIRISIRDPIKLIELHVGK